jgi:hypothetical protein
MQARPFQSHLNPQSSNATSTNSEQPEFVETLEYKRFVEFCEACRRDRYIGLCYGAPGVGKTLSAVHHSRVEKIVPFDRWSAEASDDLPIDTVLFTPEVINTPARIDVDLRQARSLVCAVARRSRRDEQGQRSTPCGAATRHGMPSIGRTETTDPVTLHPSNRPTGKLSRNTSRGFWPYRIRRL